MTFYPSIRSPTMDFALFGRTKDKIVAMDYGGGTVLYDDARRAVSPLPSMKFFKYQPVSLAVGNDLFVMANPPFDDDDASMPSAEALVDPMYRSPEEAPYMAWHPIPPPPYAKPGYDDPDAYVRPYTVVAYDDESYVCVSAKTHGTYFYDMKTNMWRPNIGVGDWIKVGDWELPFSGPAVFAEELDVWFGLSERDQDILCASELLQGAVSREWDGFTVPKGHYGAPVQSFLVHLGADGRFCIAKFSQNARGQKLVTLIGVEVTRYGDGDADLQLVKHKTYHYGGLGKNNPVCVL